MFFRSYYQPDPEEYDTESDIVNKLASKLMVVIYLIINLNPIVYVELLIRRADNL